MPTACVRDRTTEPKLARSKPIKSCAWAALANDISANAVDMIRRDKVKILGPLCQVKHKTSLNRESIAMFNAALAIVLVQLNLS